MTAEAAAPGVYGKLPARGDFVSRRLGHGFLAAWDGWLQQAIPASRAALGADWLDRYLTSPIWCFVVAAETCGPAAAAGILMPSVDGVGRYFPLMLGRELPAETDLCAFAGNGAAWFAALEALALAALDDGFEMERFERPLPAAAVRAGSPAADAVPLDPPGCHRALADFPPSEVLCRAAGGAGARRTLWWSSGSERIGPSLLVCPGLPAPGAFASLLDGDWASRGWATEMPPALAPAPAPAGFDTPPAWDREG